ncbi:multiple epidermal growth factor-like domains protein 10 isoform X2 [Mya arenaria]|nr:multiple epidermal growth factor-like domains protein 10 isoform X2 [Mya arenaria]
MRLLWVCLLCNPALFVKGQELDCTEPCSCCNLNGASGCGYNPAIEADFCFDGCVDTIYGHKCKDRCSGNCLKCEQEHGTPCYACKNTYFNTSTHCSQKCSNGCNDSLCDDDGNCSCLTNFVGSTCNDCLDGFFGEHCNKSCSPNCTYCDRFTGVCNECSTNTVYGEYCDVPCNQTCIESKCLRTTGNCAIGCMPNYYDLKCDKECSENCKDGGSNLTQCYKTARCNGCKTGFMGNTCETPCYENCTSCEQDTGVCDKCSNNTMHGTYCNNTCSPTCIDNKCNKDTGVCNHGCTKCTGVTNAVVEDYEQVDN